MMPAQVIALGKFDPIGAKPASDIYEASIGLYPEGRSNALSLTECLLVLLRVRVIEIDDQIGTRITNEARAAYRVEQSNLVQVEVHCFCYRIDRQA